MKNFQHLAFINRKNEIRYDRSAICRELWAIADGRAYYENALYIARDLPELDETDRDELTNWLNGVDRKLVGNHKLQDVIIKIEDAERSQYNIHSSYSGTNLL